MGPDIPTESLHEWGTTTVAGATIWIPTGTCSDYDVRLSYRGGNATAGQGAITMEAAGGLHVTGSPQQSGPIVNGVANNRWHTTAQDHM